MISFRRDKYWIIAVIALVINVIVGIHYYKVGKQLGERSEVIKQLNAKLDIMDSIIHNDSLMVSIAQKQSDSINSKRDVLRSHIKIVHDTTYAEPDSGSDDIEQVISDNPQIAHLIMIDDSTISALRRINQDQAKSINDLYANRSLLQQKVTVLESNQHIPRLSHGVQVGIGYCRSAISGVPCIYAGYGYSVRF